MSTRELLQNRILNRSNTRSRLKLNLLRLRNRIKRPKKKLRRPPKKQRRL